MIHQIGRVPCDTQMRTILDDLEPEALRPAFKVVFLQLQRGKVLESMAFLEGCYLILSSSFWHSFLDNYARKLTTFL